MAKADEQLMELCRRGSLPAFKRLMLRYQDRLMAFIYSRVRDYHFSEDIFQETFLRVWRQAGSFRPEYKFKTWLYVIAANLCRDEWRKKVRRPPLELESFRERPGEESAGKPIDDYQDGGPGPREIAAARELEGLLEEELGRLSPEHQEVVVMSRIMGLTYEEIAEVLGVPSGTIRSRLHYALEQLRQRLAMKRKEGTS